MTVTAPDAISDVTSRMLAIQQRIAALGGAVPASGTLTSDTSGTSATFASTLAQMSSSLGSGASGATGSGVTGESIVDDAMTYLGTPYQWGGTDPSTGLDCSGFTQRVMADLGVSIPRTAAEQATAGTPVASLDDAQPGDLVILDGGHHVGIYVGGGQMIDAPKTGDVVKVQKVWGTPTAIRRVTSDASASLSGSGVSTGASSALTSYLRSAILGGASGATGTTSALQAALGIGAAGASAGGSGVSTSSLDTTLGGLLGQSSGSDQLSSLVAALTSARSGGASSSLSTTSTTSTTSASASSSVAAYQSLFDAATAKYGLPSGLLSSVAQVESGGDAAAESSAGAQGLMQLMPGTAASLRVDPTDPAQAVDGAARLLASHLKQFGSVPLALAAYNAGPGNVTKYAGIPPFAETQSYVRKVSTLMATSHRSTS